MIDVVAVPLLMITAVSIGYRFPRRLFRGVLTRKMCSLVYGTNARQWPVDFQCLSIRLLQVVLLAVLSYTLLSSLAFWLLQAGLYLDDLLTGDDDDRWRRRWESLKNKVKWKMRLPVLVPVRGTA